MEERTIYEIQSEMRSDALTSLVLTQAYLERIEQIDRRGPKVNSVIETNPDALAIAESLDKERKAGRVRGLLHGIPILLKDNIDTGGQMQTTAGSLALEGSIAAKDAFIVSRLREAGAVILGKANLSEWANFRGARSISGWSSRGGLTRNPHVLDRTASGSSSGSAAAVAANLCSVAVGTETDGSIISPAQTTGIVGIKPTLGLLSRSGIIPIAHSQDTPGPMARTVTDAAILLGAMTGIDPNDPATHRSRRCTQQDYSAFLDPDGLKGARIGVARNLAGTNSNILHIFEACIKVMKSLGTVIIDPADVPNANKFGKTEFEVLLYEFKADLNAYLGSLGKDVPVHSVADVIAFNEKNAERVMPYFGQEHFLAAQRKGALTSAKYRTALRKNHRLTRAEGINAVMKKHRLDAIVAPSGGPAWQVDFANGDQYCTWGVKTTSLSAVAGYPHITVPAGMIFGLPVGLSFFGRAWQEPVLIRLAYAFEQATQMRCPPEFRKTADFKATQRFEAPS